MNKLAKIIDVQPGEGFQLTLTYSDGVVAVVDLAGLAAPDTVFEPLGDPELFRSAHPGPRGRSLAWTGEIELDADALRMDPALSGGHHRLLSLTLPEGVDPVSLEVGRALALSGTSQREVAARMNTTQSAVSRLADPEYHGHSVAALRRLADALGCDLQVRFVPREADQRAS